MEFTAAFELGPAYKSIAIFGHSELFKNLGDKLNKEPKSNQTYVEIPIADLEKKLEQDLASLT